uniref:Wall-associated receptor kinase galacturonan-binding domain-containing protein n=1 Tax=Triticum aestivum TaxID=4565 RepID=A0A077RUT7_WHEAT|nr:unnamed protein product [Triticum aestivum]
MPPSCWLLVFVWVWWLPLMLARAEEQQGDGCSGSAKRCGNMTISHPFWLTDWETEPVCGLSDFEVTCSSNTPVLQSSVPFGYGFAIIDISYEEQSFCVAALAKLYLVQAPNICGVPIWNTSAKLGIPFRIDPINLKLILYSCTQAAAAFVVHRDRELVQTRMRCENKSEVFVRAGGHYNEMSSYDSYEGCDAAVMPVLGSSGEANAGNYEQLINNGFLLTWKRPLSTPARASKFTRQITF